MKRVNAFDVIRGFAAVFLIILHTGYHHWTGSAEIEGGTQESDPTIGILVFFLTLGGIFYAIMGAVNSYMFYHRIKAKINTVKQLQLNSLLLGFMFILLHYFFRIFVSADSGILYYLIKDQNLKIPDIRWIISSSTLPMLGYNVIIIGLIIPLLISNILQNDIKRNQIYWILGISGFVIVFLSIPIRSALAGTVETWISADKYFPTLFIAPFVYDNFPIFPMAGFGLFGAILGIMLAREEKYTKIFLYTIIQAVFWLTLGIIGIQARGGIDPDLSLLHTPAGIYEDFFRHAGQIGICFVFFFMALFLFDYLPQQKNIHLMKYFKWLRPFSLVSLTIYVFEGITTLIFVQVIDLFSFMENWNLKILNVIFFGVIMVIIWGISAHFWKKSNFKGSLEWILLKIAEKISGKKTMKYQKEPNLLETQVLEIKH